MTFEEWWNTNEHGWGTEQLAEHKLAKDAWMAAVRNLITTFQFYEERVLELEKHKHKFPDPYLKMICNILANGKIDAIPGGRV